MTVNDGSWARHWTLARVALRYAAATLVANVVGAAVVFCYLLFLLPDPPSQLDPDRVNHVNTVAAAIALPPLILVGIAVSSWRFRTIARAYLRGEQIDEAGQLRLLRAPLAQAKQLTVLWLVATAFFVVLNLRFAREQVVHIGGTIALAGLVTSALGYFIAERSLRPVVADALAGRAFRGRAPVLGVTPRLLLAWALSTGVPLAGIGVSYLDHAPAERAQLVGSTLFLVAVGLVVGLIGMAYAARSVAEPISGVIAALARVETGDLDVVVAVDDGSEVGQLQGGVNAMVHGLRERQRLADLFGRHVGADVAAAAVAGGTRLGGEVREVSALFVDIVGSTELATRAAPEEVVSLLNAFFGIVVEVVEAAGGLVNKFEGDAALCVFGAPVSRPDHAAAALAAARELKQRLQQLGSFGFGIGVSTGQVVAGNVGALSRYEYTVIGDAVNAAARLSDLAKEHPSGVLAAGETVEAAGVGSSSYWREDGRAVLRGRGVETRLMVPA